METLTITIQLKGDEAKAFSEYKEKSFIRNKAEAGRKLILERLAQLNKEPIEERMSA